MELKTHLSSLQRIRDNEILRIITYLLDEPEVQTSTNTLSGIIAVFPGSCAMIEDVRQTISKNIRQY